MEFEKRLGRLEEIVHNMEKGDLTLQQALQLFEEGVKLSREAQEQLTQSEAQVKKLVGFTDSGEAITEIFLIPETDKNLI